MRHSSIPKKHLYRQVKQFIVITTTGSKSTKWNESNSSVQNIFCHLWSSVETKNEGYTTKVAKIPTEYHGVFQRQREVSWCSSYKLFLVCSHVTMAAMLVVRTITSISKDLHENTVSRGEKCFCSSPHQHSRRDVTCKSVITIMICILR